MTMKCRVQHELVNADPRTSEFLQDPYHVYHSFKSSKYSSAINGLFLFYISSISS